MVLQREEGDEVKLNETAVMDFNSCWWITVSFFFFALIQVVAYPGYLSIIYSDSGPTETISVSGTYLLSLFSLFLLSLFFLFVRGEP